MTARTNVMARKAEMHYTGLPIERRLTKDEDRCPFSLAVYQDATGYYMKSTNCTGPHQFHPRQDQLHASTSLLVEEEFQLQEDLNSARAKLGAAVNLYYICSACQGAPTVLLSSQIAYVCKKKSSDLNGKDHKSGDGKTDHISKCLEQSGNYYASLLACGPSMEPTSATDPTCKAILFNESRIGNVTCQEDVLLSCADDHDMLQTVKNHRRELKIADSEEMMVGIVYGMPCELEQFGLFHVLILHPTLTRKVSSLLQ
jgi:hypothetical protein